jgi:hypothetical protein
LSVVDRILSGLRDLIVMREELARTSEGVRSLAADVRDHERRLIRIETMIEMSRGSGGPPALPG